MPRVLIVSYCYPPDASVGGKRAFRVATGLAGSGWDVDVLTVRPSYFDRLDTTLVEGPPAFGVRRTHAITPLLWGRRLRDRLRRSTAPDGEARAAAPATADPRAPHPLWRRLLTTPDEFAGWAPPATFAGILETKRPDVILATAPPFTGHLVAGLLARVRRCALVLDYRDPWTTLREAAASSGPCGRLERSMESWCLRRASAVVATTHAIGVSVRAIAPVRTEVIPNAFDPAAFSTVVPTRFPVFTMLYAGSFYATRSARPVLEAIRRLRSTGRLPEGGLTLRVLGATGAEVEGAVAGLGVSDCVEVEDFLPYREALCRMGGADILLLVVGGTHGAMVPAKLFDYLGAGRFILAIGPRGSEAGAILRESRGGEEFEAGDVEGIAACIARRMERRHEPWPAPVVPARFTVGATTAALDALLRNVISPDVSGQRVKGGAEG